MRRIFVYGILQKEHSAESHGLTANMYRGKASLYGFERTGLCHIKISENENSKVIGDVWEVPNELEEELYRFEAGFGYDRQRVNVMYEDNSYHTCIVYLLDWRE